MHERMRRWISDLKILGVIVGGILLVVPCGTPSYYGNLSVYIDSFLIDKKGIDNHSKETTWMTMAFIVTYCNSTFIAGYLESKIGPLKVTLLGVLIFNVGMLTSFFSIQHSFGLLHLTFGFLIGFGTALVYSMMLLYFAVWAPKRIGIVTSLLSGTIGGGGGLIYNPVISLYINPDNMEPDISSGNSRYFSQDQIVDRVPNVFLVLGGISFGLQLIGLPLLRHHPSFDIRKNSRNSKVERQLIMTSTEEGLKNGIVPKEGYGAKSHAISGQPTSKVKQGIAEMDKDIIVQDSQEIHSIHTEISALGLTPRKMVKTLSFYLLWGASGLIIAGAMTEYQYYKPFGLLHIKDDYFLANTGTALCMGVMLLRVPWGIAVDKLPLKTVMLVIAASHTVCVMIWYFTAFVDKWLFLVMTSLVQGIAGGILLTAPVATLKFYGHDYYVTNYGLVLAGCSLINIAFLFTVQPILTYFGWFWVYFASAFASLVAMSLVIALPP